MATFYNQATLTYNGTTVTSNRTIGELQEVLGMTKTALNEEYTPGSDITYVINLTNSDTVPLTGVTITDALGETTFGNGTLVPLTYRPDTLRVFSDGALLPSPNVTSESPLTFSNLTVPAQGNLSVIYEATVNEFAPPTNGGTITNIATATADALTEPVRAEAVIRASDQPALTISKTLSPAVVSENDPLTYTFFIENTGTAPVDAASGAVVSDTFTPPLRNLTVSLNGTPLTPDQYSYNETTGAFSTGAGVLTVPASSYTQDPTTGAYIAQPGTAVLTVTGTI